MFQKIYIWVFPNLFEKQEKVSHLLVAVAIYFMHLYIFRRPSYAVLQN